MTTNKILQAAISAAVALSGCTPPHHPANGAQPEATATPTPGTNAPYYGAGGGGTYTGGVTGQPRKKPAAEPDAENRPAGESEGASGEAAGEGEGDGHGGGGIGGSGTGGEGG
jgi:hypothetical protein